MTISRKPSRENDALNRLWYDASVNHSAPSAATTPRISAKDIAFSAALPVLCAVSWLAPARLRRGIAGAISRASEWVESEKARKEEARFAGTFGIADTKAFRRVVRTVTYDEVLLLLSLHRPGGPTPATLLRGRAHLDAAYVAGKGAILWVAPTSFGPALTKIALKRSGIALWHLSRPSHGFSNTAFGRKFLNPIRTTIENGNLAGRIVITDGNVRTALGEIALRLSENKAVSITMGTEARAVSTVPFLHGTLTVAKRPIALAVETGAALLPVVTLEQEDGSFVTEIGPPLLADAATGDDALRHLGEFLAPLARSYPEQFARASMFWPPDEIRPSP